MGRPFLVSALLLAAAGCRTPADGSGAPAPDRSASSFAAPPGRGARGLAERRPPAWFEDERAVAEAELARGELKQAAERLYRALEARPGDVERARLEDLLRRVNRRVLEVRTLAGSMEAGKSTVVVGESVRVRVRLRNASGQRVRIPAAQRGVSGSLFVFDVERSDHDTRANVVRTTTRVYRPLARALDLAPGASTEVVLDIGTIGNDRPLDGVRRFRIGGMLRPNVLEVGGLRRWEAVPLEPVEIRSFRENYKHLADDPVRRIGEAIDKNAPLHLVTAAALVPPERRTEAVDALLARLQGGRRIDFAILAALIHVCEVEFGRDPSAWKAWRPRVRETYFAQPAGPERPDPEPGDRPDEPVFADE